MMTPIFANVGSFWQWVILFAIVLVVFGAKRLPEVARNLGKSLGEFKKARKEFEEELMKAESDAWQPKPASPKPLEAKTVEAKAVEAEKSVAEEKPGDKA